MGQVQCAGFVRHTHTMRVRVVIRCGDVLCTPSYKILCVTFSCVNISGYNVDACSLQTCSQYVFFILNLMCGLYLGVFNSLEIMFIFLFCISVNKTLYES